MTEVHGLENRPSTVLTEEMEMSVLVMDMFPMIPLAKYERLNGTFLVSSKLP